MRAQSPNVRVSGARSRSGLLLSLAIALLAQPASALTISVDAPGGYTSLDAGINQMPLDTTFVFTPGGGQRIDASGSVEVRGSSDPLLAFAGASASGFAFAEPGTVKVRVATSASNMSFIPNVPFLSYVPSAGAGFIAMYRELVEVKHPTLPAGSPVTFNAILDVDGFSNGPADFSGIINLQWFAGLQGGPYVGSNPVFPNGLFRAVPLDLAFMSQSFEIAASVGDLIDTSVRVSVSGGSRAGQLLNGTSYGAHQETVIDVSNTIRLFLDSTTTPDLEFIGSVSMHDYRPSAAVPEPAELALLLVSAAGLIAARRRTRSSGSAR